MLYAIGDIHGRLDKLDELLSRLPLRDEDRLVFLGDYVDRGPDSQGVIDRLIRVAEQRSTVFLLGNHESMFLDFLGWSGPQYFGADVFIANGGAETLLSYDYFETPAPRPRHFVLPAAHEAFFRSLQLHHVEGDFLFVHAGLGRALSRSDHVEQVLRRARTEELLWDRSTMDVPHRLGITVVYGHTPRPDFQVRWNRPYSIGIDTGAVYGGPLTALRLPDETIFQA
ncbi:serine/threonine protein phosphatase [Myxococcota bacterium]|nr:serine/threonine protein phosphatase [Myxococcota bacterium]MCZ7620043.1 serine/threonine protein phosphatase [Myxococcota bacterium]